jgi:hypothetical protein
MRFSPFRSALFLLPALCLLLIGCPQQGDDDVAVVERPVERTSPDAQRDMRDDDPDRFRIEIHLTDRELRVMRGDSVVETHPVAIGDPDHPTPTGRFEIDRVIWNPEWIPPPDSEWAEDRERKEPGDPDNPLGRAQLIYDRPHSIHGTDDLESLGEAASHGSIRVSNEVAVELARTAMEEGGESRPDEWFDEVDEDRTDRRVVVLSRPIPLRILNGDGDPDHDGGS